MKFIFLIHIYMCVSSKETWPCMKANIHFGTLGQKKMQKDYYYYIAKK